MTNEPCTHRNSPRTHWALGYLREESKGFARGNVVWATLKAAIDWAIVSGASAEEISVAVSEGGKDATNASERTLDVM